MSLDQARAYLHRVLPWPPQGDADAYINIHWTTKNKKDPVKGRDWWQGRACQSIDDCLSAVSFAMSRADTKAVYVCLSSQRFMNVKAISGRNGAFNIQEAVRDQKNAVQLRSLFLDIDVKEGGNGYATTRDAVAALRDFCSGTGLPTPQVVVASGTGGVHVYWVLHQCLSPAEWQPLANALAEATRRHGLRCDTQCTVDSARVLRVPGTLNTKLEPPVPVKLAAITIAGNYDADELRGILAPYMVRQAPAAGVTAVGNVISLPARGPAVHDELSAGVEARTSRPIDLVTIAENGCGFLKEALESGGANYSNPLWNLATLIATFGGEAGRDMAHRMASGHATYSQEETDELFDRKLRERDEKDLGWPRCQSIQNAGCTACATCPHLGANLSPLNLARSAAPSVPAASVQQGQDLPGGFIRDPNGLVKRLAPDGGTNLVVSPYPLYGAWLQDNPWTLHFTTRLGSTARETRISIEMATLSSRDYMKHLGAQGFTVLRSQSTLLQDFLVSWSKRLQDIHNAVVSASPFGWMVEEGGKTDGFCYGGRVWTPTGDRPAAAPDPIIGKHYGPKGSLEPWVKAAKLITDQNRPALDAILGAAFGGPLIKFTGENGAQVAVYSQESGIGKTTTMRIAQAVWGHPQKALQGLTDTSNAVINKMGQLKAIPLFWDELKTDHDTQRFVGLTFQLTQGKEKARLNADAHQRDPGDWQTLLLSASNESLLDHVTRQTKTTSAGVMRVFEYVVTPGVSTGMTHGAVARMVEDLNENFGQAGLAYAKYLGANHAKIRDEVAKTNDQLTVALKAPPEERFWIAAITCILCGARYSNHLQLTNINLTNLLGFLRQVLVGMRAYRASQPVDMKNALSVTSLLHDYLADAARHTLFTNRIHVGRGRPIAGEIKVTARTDLNKLNGVHIQIGEENSLMRISQNHFREWLVKRGYSPGAVFAAICDPTQIGGRQLTARLGSGTQWATPTLYAIELDTSGNGLTFEDPDVTDVGNILGGGPGAA